MTFWERIKLFMGAVGDFLAPMAKSLATSVGQVVMASAMQAVQATAEYALDNDEAKRKKAYQAIVKDLKNQGIKVGVDVTTSFVNAALENAVQKMKASEQAQ